jgi:hypothetical protein
LGFSANTLSRSNSFADNVMARRYFMVGFLVFSHDIVVSHGVLCLACFDWTGWPDLTVTAAPGASIVPCSRLLPCFGIASLPSALPSPHPPLQLRRRPAQPNP